MVSINCREELEKRTIFWKCECGILNSFWEENVKSVKMFDGTLATQPYIILKAIVSDFTLANKSDTLFKFLVSIFS